MTDLCIFTVKIVVKHGFCVAVTPKTYDFLKDDLLLLQKIIRASSKSSYIFLEN